jgi:hypothetical protein
MPGPIKIPWKHVHKSFCWGMQWELAMVQSACNDPQSRRMIAGAIRRFLKRHRHCPPQKKMVDRILMADWTINLIQFSHAFCTITIPRFVDGHATINMELSIKQIHGHPIVVDWPTDTYTMFWPANRTEPDSRSWDRNSEVIKPYGSSTSLNLVVTNHIVKPCGWKMHPLYYIYMCICGPSYKLKILELPARLIIAMENPTINGCFPMENVYL